MLQPFFVVAMQSHSRQKSFRQILVLHLGLIAAITYLGTQVTQPSQWTLLAYVLLALGIIEGAGLIGWRLTQLPKSQALEFLLTSPLQPRRVFFAEALVGMTRFLWIQLAGWPILGCWHWIGLAEPADYWVLAIMPTLWGLVAGSLITAWVYEPEGLRRIGELFGLLAVLIYLVVGILAAENLLLWLQQIPEGLGRFIYNSVRLAHDYNPFGVVRYWLASDRVEWIAWDRLWTLNLVAVGLILLGFTRAAFRLLGHFHARHYKPIDSSRASQVERIGDAPLSWWAVRRVMEYSGRVNLWLAGGFCALYALFLIAGDHWPSWMGRLVFQLFENWGGPPAIAAACVVMATVPAVFQFGLWDATTSDRCRRLELLLLTDLREQDYWHASLAASWRRGRGYLLAASFLWVGLAVSGRNDWLEVLGTACAAVLVWGFSFAVGFRSFAHGAQTSGLASLLVLGVPMLMVGLLKLGYPSLAHFTPIGLLYLPLTLSLTPVWFIAYGILTVGTLLLTKIGLAQCDAGLRRWYDANQGQQATAA